MTHVGQLSQRDIARQLAHGGLTLKIGSFDVCLSSNLPNVAEDLHRLYADYELSTEQGVVDFYVTVKPPSRLRRWLRPQVQFYLDANSPFKPLPLAQGFAMFEWGLNWCIASNAHQYLNIHAAVVERNGKALILPGTPGSGKSTLCAGLVSQGWRLLSDEMTLIGLDTGLVHPIPRPISLKNESIDIVRSLSSDIYIGQTVMDTAKGTVAHMRPPLASVRAGEETATPAFIVFPKYTKGAQTCLAPIGQGRTLLQTAENSFNYHVLGAEGFSVLANVVAQCGCFEFTYPSMSEGISAMEGLLDG